MTRVFLSVLVTLPSIVIPPGIALTRSLMQQPCHGNGVGFVARHSPAKMRRCPHRTVLEACKWLFEAVSDRAIPWLRVMRVSSQLCMNCAFQPSGLRTVCAGSGAVRPASLRFLRRGLPRRRVGFLKFVGLFAFHWSASGEPECAEPGLILVTQAMEHSLLQF